IAGNAATASNGGGIALVSHTGNVVVQNSTITGNSAGNATAGARAGGGGISKTGTTTGTLTLTSTIVAGNTAARGSAAADVAASGTSPVTATFSAIGNDPGAGVLSSSSGSNLAFGANLQLQPLADNGGPTQTVALGGTSAAIDAGANPANVA